MFDSNQFDSTPSFVSSQTADPSPSSAKSRDAQPMHPVTVKQIVEAKRVHQTATSRISSSTASTSTMCVKLMGMVFDKTARVTDVSFVIDDGTGRIGCKRWLMSSLICFTMDIDLNPLDTQEVEELRDGIYVRVHGHLSSYKGKKEIVLYAISKASSTATTPNNGQQTISSSQVSQDHSMDGLGSIDKMVLDYLQLPTSNAKEQGISQEKIAETMESLESEGLVYSTIDEFHYKSVSA
ncbi:hypothetical protein SASPL_127137 [Salvia splendens]|uniref:Replication protein A C-terminal domain-containing protein n=1 Tax=Salvia splendens TaxID=180675 RepID=A0A8X8XIF2_SALSN|nr:hypothetical protein SASPL_127137 [Salvia splendens]